MQTNDYLMHWGILGMKWGKRRFQNQDGTLTSEGKIRYGSGTSVKDGQNGAKLSKRAQKAKAKADAERAKRLADGRKKAAEEKLQKKIYEEEKETALKKGTASDILKYRGDLTHEQMQNAINRLNDEDRLRELAAREVKTNSFQNKAQRAAKTLGTIREATNNAQQAVSNIKSVVDTLRKMSGDGKTAEQKRIQNIVDHGTAEEVEKNLYKMNGEQAKNAHLRLKNLEGIKSASKTEAEYNAARKAEKKAAEEAARAKVEARAEARRIQRQAKENSSKLSDYERRKLREYAKRRSINSMTKHQPIVKKVYTHNF